MEQPSLCTAKQAAKFGERSLILGTDYVFVTLFVYISNGHPSTLCQVAL